MTGNGITALGLSIALVIMPHVAIVQLLKLGSTTLNNNNYHEHKNIWIKTIQISSGNAVRIFSLSIYEWRQVYSCQKVLFGECYSDKVAN